MDSYSLAPEFDAAYYRRLLEKDFPETVGIGLMGVINLKDLQNEMMYSLPNAICSP